MDSFGTVPTSYGGEIEQLIPVTAQSVGKMVTPARISSPLWNTRVPIPEEPDTFQAEML